MPNEGLGYVVAMMGGAILVGVLMMIGLGVLLGAWLF